MIFIFSLAVALLISLLLFILLNNILRKRDAVSTRIKNYAGVREAESLQKEPWHEKLRRFMRQQFSQRRRGKPQSKRSRNLDLLMIRAGLPLMGQEYITISLTISLVSLVIGWIFSGAFVSGLIIGLIAMALQWMYVKHLVRKRMNKFLFQMSDCLTLISNSLRAGFSFLQTAELISKEMDDPIGTEFARVVRDTNLGRSLERALKDMDERVGNDDFSLLVTAVIIQQQVGGNLAVIVDSIRDTIIDRIRLRREIRTLTAQGRATGIVLAMIPVAMALFFFIVSPEYLDPLIHTTMGQAAIAVSLILECVGFFVIKRIMDIKE